MHDRNKNRPGYKETNVGWIPEEWEALKLGKEFKITSGGTPNRTNHKDYFLRGHIPWVKTTDLNNSILIDTSEHITAKALKEASCKMLPANTVLVAMYGGLKQIGRTGLLKKQAACNQALAAVLPSKKYSSQFLLYYLNGRVGYWKRLAASSRKDPNITKNDVADFPILSPPLPEQEAIAEVLGCWDEGIETLEKLIEAKKLRKKGLMQRLLSGQSRLPGFGAECRISNAEYRMPTDWKEVRLGDVFKERKETKYNDLPLLAITGNRGIIPADEVNKKDSSNADKSKYKRICPGDLGYNTMRMWQGVSAISSLEGIVSPAYTICIPSKELDAKFIGYLFKTAPVIFRFWRYSQGLVDDTLNLKFPNFAQIHITIPTLAEQKAIAAVLETADEEIRLLEAELAALAEQKQGLMQKLLTGEKRLPAFQKGDTGVGRTGKCDEL